MFGWSDMPKLLFSFLIVIPLVSVIHQLGHSLMAIILGGRVDFTIGQGRTIFRWKKIKIKSIYFLHSFCIYEKLKYDNRFTHVCVYAGGTIANLASILLVYGLIMWGVLSKNLFSYQFVYFSIYYIVFSLLPFEYSETSLSDGRAIYDALRYGKITCNPD
ncbi:site-2 protease family protein [Priestia megaterium]|uniref:site-2 protease family protein n=1 Tax=Priestia megaterium TaxID=1404 RepID=UPI00159C5A0F|nr:site-2 protease family protein [Priestia megaterium]